MGLNKLPNGYVNMRLLVFARVVDFSVGALKLSAKIGLSRIDSQGDRSAMNLHKCFGIVNVTVDFDNMSRRKRLGFNNHSSKAASARRSF